MNFKLTLDKSKIKGFVNSTFEFIKKLLSLIFDTLFIILTSAVSIFIYLFVALLVILFVAGIMIALFSPAIIIIYILFMGV